jgi:hypothetical protein
MIRPGKSGEPATDVRNHDQTTREAKALDGALRVVGDSLSVKGYVVNTGDKAGEVSDLWGSPGVTAAVGAKKPPSSGGLNCSLESRMREICMSGSELRVVSSISIPASTKFGLPLSREVVITGFKGCFHVPMIQIDGFCIMDTP